MSNSVSSDIKIQYGYNIPDEYETNTNLLRAELMTLAIPESIQFSDEVYGGLKDIEYSCSVDYQNFCTEETAITDISSNLLDLFFPITNQRRLSEELKSSYNENNGKALLLSFKDHAMFATGMKKYAKPISIQYLNTKLITQGIRTPNKMSKSLRGVFKTQEHQRKLTDCESDSDNESENGNEEDEKFMNNFQMEGHHHHDGNKPIDSPPNEQPLPPLEDEHDSHDGHDEHDHHPEGPDDIFYSGALGYGATGDMCIYKNFQQLSEPCQNSIKELYGVRQNYWTATVDSKNHHHPHMLFSFMLLALGGLIMRRAYLNKKRNQQMNKILEIIHSNDALKANLEAQSGVQVPKPLKCNGKSIGRTILLIIISIISALMISISSLIVTVAILETMEHPDPNTGDVSVPSVSTAFLVLGSVSLIELLLFVGLVRTCIKKKQQTNTIVATETSEVHIVSNNNDFDSSSNTQGRTQTQGRVQFYTYLQSMWPINRNNSSSDGYVPLMNDETQHGHRQGGAEMVTVSAPMHVQDMAANGYVFSVPIQPGSSVSAQPVSHIRMI